ncbi:hypothetical protein [Kallotenue papyrolyticum]|uniref:hypothetical protein n=1 Tax=Kallotenue papyrolyticum TaxID=1325125 RepID=UPI000472FC14|nr:hypothetical protein [Kallotenue papyrolyticum]
MATIIDLLRHLGRGAAPDGGQALAGPLVLPATNEAPLPLPLTATLTSAWARLAGRPTHAYHALALSAAQAGESLALMGHGPAAQIDLLLPLFQQRLSRPDGTTLCIMPEDAPTRAAIAALATALGLSLSDASSVRRPQPSALVLATPQQLQQRLLPAAERAWRWLWPRLDQLALPLLHATTGIAAGHLHWLLRRVERLAQRAPLPILAALAPVADAEQRLQRLLERPCRVIAAPYGAPHPTLVALWRCSPDRAAAARQLYQALRERQLAVTLLGRDAAESERLLPHSAEDGVASDPSQARIAIVMGVPRTPVERQALLRRGYRLLILLAGDEPHERLFAEHPDRLAEGLPQWPLALANPYVASAALACAALEQPLNQAEIDRWQVRELRDRLLRRGTLRALPGDELWPAGSSAAERCAELDPISIGGRAYQVRAPDGRLIDWLPPALLDRCALPGQVWQPGWAVARRDDASGVIQLRDDPGRRLTLPLARVEVVVREELDARRMNLGAASLELVRGKALVTHQVTGLLELRPDAQPRVLSAPASESQWSAAVCWFHLPVAPPDPRVTGWALLQTLPLLTLGHPAGLFCTYDPATQRCYVLESEPGGNGVIEAWYPHLEQLLTWALDLCAACRADPLYAPLAASEAAWLEGLRQPVQPGHAPALPVETNATAIAHDDTPPAEANATAIAHDEAPPTDEAPPACASPASAVPVVQPATTHAAPEHAQSQAPPAATPAGAAQAPAPVPPDATSPPETAARATPAPPPVTVAQPPAADDPSALEAAPADTADTAAPEEQPVDVAALIARMRRLREQRATASPSGQSGRHRAPGERPAETFDTQALRFHIGERVQCLPYGAGVVRASRLVDGREQLTVEFPEYGAIEIDPAVSLVRSLGRAQDAEQS